MPSFSPKLLEEIRKQARAHAIEKGFIRQPNRDEDNAHKIVIDRPKVLLSDLYIRTKDKKVVPLEPNDVQQVYLDMILPQWRSGNFELRRAQEVILKARQFGFSTLIMALFFLDTVNVPNTESVLVAHDSESTEKMFRMVRLFHERLPASKKPVTKSANRKELVYPEINSTFRIMTAGTGTAGHSATINNLLASEVSRWPDAQEVFAGLFGALTSEGNAFLESTANGEGYAVYGDDGEEVFSGNAFHIYFKKAQVGDSQMKARFFAWFQHGLYREDPGEDFVRVTAQDTELFKRYGDEQELVNLYSVDDWQLRWRRSKIDSPGYNLARFREQFPSNPVEAFRIGGQNFFSTWDETLHTCEPFEIPAFWGRFNAYDWGGSSPFAFYSYAVDPLGNVYATHEMYAPNTTNPVQAKAIKELTQEIGTYNDPVWSDSSCWSGKTQADGTVMADVNFFLDVGLCMVPAVRKNDKHTWSNAKAMLAATIERPVDMTQPNWWFNPGRTKSFMVFRPGGGNLGCPNLIRTIPIMKRNPLKPDQILEVVNGRPVEDHAVAAGLGYGLSHFIISPDAQDGEEKPKSREQILRDAGALQDRADQKREMWG